MQLKVLLALSFTPIVKLFQLIDPDWRLSRKSFFYLVNKCHGKSVTMSKSLQYISIQCSNPTLAKKTAWRSVFLCIYHCNFNANPTKIHSSSVAFVEKVLQCLNPYNISIQCSNPTLAKKNNVEECVFVYISLQF